MPKISAIVPVYNAQRYLEETLDSLLRQTLSDIEILCVDDGSTDHTPNILREISSRDPRIRVFTKENGGVGSARNLGIEYARGEYLSFIDSDDIVSEDYLEQLYAGSLPDKPDMVVTGNVLEYWPDGSKNTRNVGVLSDATLTTPREKAPLITATGLTQNKLYKASFIYRIGLQHYPGKSVSEDNYFTICSVALASSIKTISRGTYFYRQRPESITKTKKRPDDLSIYDVYAKAKDFIHSSNACNGTVFEWDDIITMRQQVDLTNYHFALAPPDRAHFRKLAKRMTEDRIRIPRPEKEARTIIKFHIKSILAALGLYHTPQ